MALLGGVERSGTYSGVLSRIELKVDPVAVGMSWSSDCRILDREVYSEWLLEQESVFASIRVALVMAFGRMLDRHLSRCLSEHWNRPSFSCRIWLACDQSVSYLRPIHLQAS